MIRNGDWKFIDRYNGPRELYNLNNDPDERENLVDCHDYAARRDELSTALHDWFSQHQTACENAWERDVRGFGQVHPPRRGLNDQKTYVAGGQSMDGTQK